ncbi:cytochrome c5 [Legionella nautarum]|uniref:Cytochrome c5 n=1 Tax=Legionella nautarum TaxID=45070 RepID=A0A0W0WUU4_9GAMM|nr:c-type cytochrome [Legionella nautarum]KTD36091.1 cytochrome c5 [Legionella nautarum]
MLKLGFIIVCFLSFNFAQAANHHPQEFLQSIKGAQDEGAQIVQHFCSSCHAEKPLIPLGAPKIGNENDWAPRIKTGIRSLFKHTEEGFNAMPARGGCFECSDEQLVLALLAMLPEPLKKEVLSTEKVNK